jgi:hypothetical protein
VQMNEVNTVKRMRPRRPEEFRQPITKRFTKHSYLIATAQRSEHAGGMLVRYPVTCGNKHVVPANRLL